MKKDKSTTTTGLGDDILSYRWKNRNLIRTIYGDIPEDVKEVGERVKYLVDGMLNSLEFSIAEYFFPLSLILYFSLTIYTLIEELWISLIIISIIFLYSNYALYDLKRIAVNKFSKILKKDSKTIERKLRKTDFLLDIMVGYKRRKALPGEDGGVVRNFEMKLIFKRKILKGNCLRRNIKKNKKIMELNKKKELKGILKNSGRENSTKEKKEKRNSMIKINKNNKKGIQFSDNEENFDEKLLNKKKFEININGDEMICFKPKDDIVDYSSKKKL